MVNFYTSLLVVIFSFNALGIATKLGPGFQDKNPELYEVLLKAEAYCTPSEKFTDEMVEVVRDSVFKQLNRFQGCSYFAKLTRLPIALASASVRSYQKGYNWYYKIEDDAGHEAKKALISMMIKTQQQHNLSQPQTACMAACVTRVILKYVSPYENCHALTTLFASTEELLRFRKASCLGYSQMFETFANELGLPTHSFSAKGASIGTAVLAVNAANYAYNENMYSNRLALCNVINFSSILNGHYLNQIKLDGRSYIFDTLHDYNPETYSCRFHER